MITIKIFIQKYEGQTTLHNNVPHGIWHHHVSCAVPLGVPCIELTRFIRAAMWYSAGQGGILVDVQLIELITNSSNPASVQDSMRLLPSRTLQNQKSRAMQERCCS